MAFPRWFSGQALVLGSMAPDFQSLLVHGRQIGFGHTIPAQFYFCLPLTLGLTWVVSRIIARPLALHLPDMGVFHLHDYRALAETTRCPSYWVLAVPSALIGSFSHIIWDSFTHYDGYGALQLGYGHTSFSAGGHEIGTVFVLQYGSSLLGGLATLALMATIGKRRLLLRWLERPLPEPAVLPTSASHKALWIPPLLGAALALAFSWYQSASYVSNADTLPRLAFLILILWRVAGSSFIGLCIGSLICSRVLHNRQMAIHL